MNFSFQAPEWSFNTSIYEVNLRQYTAEGTFRAFAAHLPRLKSMGAEVLWFMPITPIGKVKRMGILGSYYAASSYIATNEEFGTIDDFRDLVSTCHQLGFKVIIDWVANHTAWDHEWTKTHPEYYKVNTEGSFYDSNGWQDVIDLNYYDQGMRRAMISSMDFWVRECDIDGFRCDMAHLVPLDFWRDARQALDETKKLFWLAETEDYNYQYAFDCSYAWNWMHVSEKVARTEASVDDMRYLLMDYERKKLPSSNFAFFTSNHDENSWNGTEYEKYGGAALCMAVFICTWNGISLIYSGQELPNMKRLKFFEKDPIGWKLSCDLHDFYKKLLDLRSSFGTERTTVTLLRTADNSILAFTKASTSKEILVLLNCSNLAAESVLIDYVPTGTYRNVLDSSKKEAPSLLNITMEPWSYLVLEKL